MIGYCLQMTTLQRFRNKKYRIEVRERDHGPAHVHLTGGGYDVIIYLQDLSVEGDWPRGLRVEVLTWVSLHRTTLLREWKKWHQ
jgi:hypothetical protein